MKNRNISEALTGFLQSSGTDDLVAHLGTSLADLGFWGYYEGRTVLPSGKDEGKGSHQFLSTNLNQSLGERGSECLSAVRDTIKATNLSLWRERVEWVSQRSLPYLPLRTMPEHINVTPAVVGVFKDFGLTTREVLVVPRPMTEFGSHIFVAMTDADPSASDVSSAICLVQLYEQMRQERLAESGADNLLAHPDETLARPIELTERQREVLCWAAAGKTLQDIADIVGLSRRGVRYHIERARERYGYATMQQTVVRAALDYEFDPFGPDQK